jgi:NAD(P)-dependent dehydrogenase (short-subunit alcohol dehydrogenase family)
MLDYTDEEYDRVVDLNLRGTFLFLRAFGRIMVR